MKPVEQSAHRNEQQRKIFCDIINHPLYLSATLNTVDIQQGTCWAIYNKNHKC